jgi:hypothetical protein
MCKVIVATAVFVQVATYFLLALALCQPNPAITGTDQLHDRHGRLARGRNRDWLPRLMEGL